VRSGRRLAIDVGKVRIGIAASDFHAILASGLETVPRGADLEPNLKRIVELVNEVEPIEIYVGLPVSMSGNHSASTEDAIDFARQLSPLVSSEVRFIDERMTTVTAANALKLSGRDSKSGRQIIDQIAATVILEQAMEQEKSTGKQPGKAMGEINE
jgi:putative Holliday junction resolvase